jgi:hypothetical protein
LSGNENTNDTLGVEEEMGGGQSSIFSRKQPGDSSDSSASGKASLKYACVFMNCLLLTLATNDGQRSCLSLFISRDYFPR